MVPPRVPILTATPHDRFLDHHEPPPGEVDPLVLSSWRRLRQTAPDLSERPRPSPAALDGPQTPLAGISMPQIALGAIRAIAGPNRKVGILLVETDGTAIVCVGDRDLMERLETLGIGRGRKLGEEQVGTNAVDLALRELRPAVTTGWEHFGRYLHGLTIGAAPVYGLNGRQAGALAVLTEPEVGRDLIHGLATLCAESLSANIAAVETSADLGRLLSEQRAIIDNISDGLMVIGADGRIRHMNAPAGRILTLNPEQSVGRKLSELLDFEPIVDPIFATGTGYLDRELIIDSDKRHLHLVDTAIPIKDEQGRVRSVVNTFREFTRIKRISQQFAGSHARYTFDDIVGTADTLRRAVADARKAAAGTSNILLNGRSGTGKEVFAQAIHAHSGRRDAPFVAINCAALPRDLIESELFGYVSGSFTGAHKGGRPGKFEMASGGTIFLDEVTEMPLDLQAKLLRVLQEREVTRLGDTNPIPVDVRVIAASNRDLREAIERREFREDLYYRLHVISIAIPALKDRKSDIPMLATYFLRKYAAATGKPLYTIADAALQRMMEYDWPGNVRELENTLERLVVLSEGTAIARFDPPAGPAAAAPAAPPPASGLRSLREHERDVIAATVAELGHNVTKAAEVLGIARPTLYAKIREYGIPLQRTSQRGG